MWWGVGFFWRQGDLWKMGWSWQAPEFRLIHPAAGRVHSRTVQVIHTCPPSPGKHRQLLAGWDLGGL